MCHSQPHGTTGEIGSEMLNGVAQGGYWEPHADFTAKKGHNTQTPIIMDDASVSTPVVTCPALRAEVPRVCWWFCGP